MSKKKEFEEHLLEANSALKRNKKHKRNRSNTKNDVKVSDSMLATDSSIDTTNDAVDVEEEICVVEETTMMSTILIPPPTTTTTTTAAAANQTAVKPNKKRRNRRGSGTSSEEERWLDAIESGKLEQVDDELRKIKDPKLMTARQRAMYERSIDKDLTPTNDALLALPTGYKEKVLTAEALEKAQLKSQKRKQLADEKREKDKRKTMDRLLKKQETKVTKIAKNKLIKVTVPVISYRESLLNGATLSYPIDHEFPIQPQYERKPPALIVCAICNDNRKRYNCSKTNVPLCSFKCYKLNLKSFKEITC